MLTAEFMTWARAYRREHSAEELRDLVARLAGAGVLLRRDYYTGSVAVDARCFAECSHYRCDDQILIVRRGTYFPPEIRALETGCNICDQCFDHCDCPVCDACSGRQEHVCSRCDHCESCCGCSQCENCGPVESTCSDCDRCDSCCGCERCISCSEVCDSRCSDGRCETCCDRRCTDCDRQSESELDIPLAAPNAKREIKFHEPNRRQRKRNPLARYIGVEIEIAKVGGSARAILDVVDEWHGACVSDGSLPDGGFEIVTAPAGGDLFLDQIEDICRELNAADAEVDKSCGLHVHVDARDLSYYCLTRLIRIYAHVEPVLFRMVPKSRRDNQYCEPCGQRYLTHAKGPKASVIQATYGEPAGRYFPTTRKSKYVQARYAAMNLHSYFLRGTVELRLPNGTTNAAKITSWGVLWASIVEFAARSSDKEVTDFLALDPQEALVKIADGAGLAGFVAERIAKFA